MDSLHSIIRRAEQNFTQGSVVLGDYVTFSIHETIEKISAYLNSKHTSGSKDSLDREKPFFNIVTAAVNIWYRATDIDRKDIIVRADKSSNQIPAFIATIHLQKWMKEQRFGVFLNQWGRTLAQYGSAVVKFVERGGELIPSVVPWNRLIVDAVDFEALPRIEKFYRTPAQLRKMKEYNQDMVENLLEALVARKTKAGLTQDNQSEFVELYEVHGELPVYLLKDYGDAEIPEKDKTTFRQQMHVISHVEEDTPGEYKDFTLYSGKEKQDPYMITHLLEEDGRTLSIGAVEYLFDAQWMQNHTMKNMKDTLDLASKLIFQTADARYIGRNALSAIETGDILIHEDNKPLTKVNNDKGDIVALQNFSNQWKVLAQELTSTPDALRGITPPSGTPYSSMALLGQNANSLFEVMVENKGLALEDMLRRFVIPHLKKKMDTEKEISAVLEDHDIKKLDAMYIPKEAIKRYNERTAEELFKFIDPEYSGSIPSPYNGAEEEGAIQQELAPLGNQRFLSPSDISWSKAVEDLEWELEVGVTNEASDKQTILTSLATTLQTIAGFAGRPMTPEERLVFNKIMNYTGTVSPVELTTASDENKTDQALKELAS